MKITNRVPGFELLSFERGGREGRDIKLSFKNNYKKGITSYAILIGENRSIRAEFYHSGTDWCIAPGLNMSIPFQKSPDTSLDSSVLERLYRETEAVLRPSDDDILKTLSRMKPASISIRKGPEKEFSNEFRYRAKVYDSRGGQLGRWAWDVFLASAP